LPEEYWAIAKAIELVEKGYRMNTHKPPLAERKSEVFIGTPVEGLEITEEVERRNSNAR
jgi:hypothetical protein